MEDFARYVVSSEHWGGVTAGQAGGAAKIQAHAAGELHTDTWYRFVTEVELYPFSTRGYAVWHKGTKGITYKGTKKNDQDIEVDFYGFDTIVIEVSESLKSYLSKDHLELIEQNRKKFLEFMNGGQK
ncbi:hypothetical protein [Acanthopleuribacter pedis]|uniref:Uncharacterized protein n=1 Tax=Acanthopleuribacter pedis TaxID=442870 RepID=A0A8J7QNR0_9BACT|nr:hypothetical protein [Acanthopleuribacter pedis]MBO1321803.1 hypothetical protein [Acanthopleuribacter pedis]